MSREKKLICAGVSFLLLFLLFIITGCQEDPMPTVPFNTITGETREADETIEPPVVTVTPRPTDISPTPTPTPDVYELFFPIYRQFSLPDCDGVDTNRIGIAWMDGRIRPLDHTNFCGAHWYATMPNLIAPHIQEGRMALVWEPAKMNVLQPPAMFDVYEGLGIIGNECDTNPRTPQCTATTSEVGQMLFDVVDTVPGWIPLWPGTIIQHPYSEGNEHSPWYIVEGLKSAEAHFGSRQAVIDAFDDGGAIAIHVYDLYHISVETKVEWMRAALDEHGWSELDIAVTEMGVLPGVDDYSTMYDLTVQCLRSEAIYCMGYTPIRAQNSCVWFNEAFQNLTECGYGWFHGLLDYYD